MIQTIKQNKKAVLAFLLALVMVMSFFTFLAPDGLVLTVSAASYGENGMTIFVEGDQILVVNTLNDDPEQSENRAIYTYTSGQWKQTSGELTWVREQENTFKAYYPATQDFTLPTDQSSAEKLAAADRMECESKEMFNNQVNLYFEHMLTKVTFNVQYEDFSADPTLSEIKCGEITGYLNGDKIEFIVEANSMFAETEILTLKVNGVQQSVKLKDDTTFEKGTHYSYTLTIGQKEAVLTAEQNQHPGGWSENETALGGSGIPGTVDVGKTKWETGDVIYVVAANKGVDSELLTLIYGADGQWTADEETLQYLSEADTHIRAIYAPNCEKESTEIKAIDGLPFGTGEFFELECFVENGALKVDFANYTRNYSRLRIVTEPNEQITVTATMFDPAGYPDSGTYDYNLTSDANGNAYLYGTFAAGGTVKVVGDVNVEHTFTEATVAENSYALFARRGANLAKLTSTYVINDSETHYFYGSGNYGIKVASGSPTIILSDANISLNAGDAFSSAVNAIDIVAANSTTTIRVEGTENNITAKYGAGIFVAQGSTVTIVGRSRDDTLTVLAGGDAAAIGGYTTSIPFQYLNCGAINISNITVEAYGGCDESCSPGIGNVGTASSETITIDNAVVHAFGTLLGSVQSTPGIGCGFPSSGDPISIPTIVIKNNSIIHSYRGSGIADYIGWAGYSTGSTAANSAINCGTGGSIISSTVYCYTGVDATSPDKTVTYDATGNATEN